MKDERALCDSHTKLSGTVSLENWKTYVAIHAWKNRVAFTQKFRESTTFAKVGNKYKHNSSTNKTESSKGQTGDC